MIPFRTSAAAAVLAAGMWLPFAGTALAQQEELFDCSDFDTQASAQAALEAHPSDPFGLDSDGDGVACEELPGAGEQADQVGQAPEGGIDTGGGPADNAGAYVLGGLALTALGAGTAVAARRTRRSG